MKKVLMFLFIFIFMISFLVIGTDKTKKECAVKELKCPVSGKLLKKDAKSCDHKTLYYCPKEGCKYKSDKPGKCPKCGVVLKKHELKTIYACPMEKCNYKSDKPGKCPKCGMELKKCEMSQKEHAKKCKESHKHKECTKKSEKTKKSTKN